MASLTHLNNIINFDNSPPPLDEQIRDAMRSKNIEPPSVISFDGTIHRFSTKPEDERDSAGWYILYGDNVPSGSFGDWRQGSAHTFRADIGRSLTAADEMMISQRTADAKKAREEKLEKKHENAIDIAARIWEVAEPAGPEHPYLKRKGIQAHMARMGRDTRLIIPLFDESDTLTSVQYIDADGDKKNLSGGRVSGCYCPFGDLLSASCIYVAEGFATAATIAEITETATVATFSASNIAPVVGTLRKKYPTKQIVIVADHDNNPLKPGVFYDNPELYQHPGHYYAKKAAVEHGAQVILIPSVGQDANDYHLSGGDLYSLLVPKSTSWLMYDDELSEQPAPIRWLIKGWLQDQSLIMVHGPSGCGKTFVVLDWALHIAYKDEWNGCLVHGGPVVYLAGEGHHGLRGRVAVWKQEYGGGSRRFALSKSAKDLNTAIGLQETITEIRRLDEVPRLIVVDTLHRFLAGDENSAQDAKTMIDACALLQREFSCSVLLVHHTGVAEEAQTRARGSSAWRGALEIEISIRPQSGGIIIEQRKAKDSEMLDPVFVRLESKAINGWIDEDGAPVTSAVVSLSDKPITGKDLARSDQEEKDRAVLMDIIRFSEVELDPDGEMMITRSAMARYAKENLTKIGLSDESRIKQWLNKSKDSSYLGRLLRYGVIKETGISGQYVVQ